MKKTFRPIRKSLGKYLVVFRNSKVFLGFQTLYSETTGWTADIKWSFENSQYKQSAKGLGYEFCLFHTLRLNNFVLLLVNRRVFSFFEVVFVENYLLDCGHTSFKNSHYEQFAKKQAGHVFNITYSRHEIFWLAERNFSAIHTSK